MACFAGPWTEMTEHFFVCVQSCNHSKDRNNLRKMKSEKIVVLINTLRRNRDIYWVAGTLPK